MFILPPVRTSCSKNSTEYSYNIRYAPHQDTGQNVYTGCWISLLSDSPLGLKPLRILNKFNNEVIQKFASLASEYNTLAKKLMRIKTRPNGTHIVTDLESCKALLKSPVAREYIQYCKLGSPKLKRYLLSFLSFGKRYQQAADLDDLKTRALRSWKDLELKLEVLVKDIPDCVHELKAIAQHLLAPYFEHVSLPAHGAGRVAERGVVTPAEKHKTLAFDYAIDNIFFRWDSAANKVIPDSASWDPQSGPSKCGELPPRFMRYGDLVPARVTFVPKDVGSVRSICCEPAPYQYWQQSVRVALERAIARGPLYKFVRIQDQSYNSSAAKAASNHLQSVTLDLSKASDSLSWEVVKKVFPAKVLKYLYATRSRYAELPDGEIWKLVKFAPMGSAVCFPTQSIFYTLVVLREYHRYLWGERRITAESLKELNSLINHDGEAFITGLAAVRVYGDDIICDDRVADSVISTLESFGFEINLGKSFKGTNLFRESCGGYYLNNSDVTPISLKLGNVEDHLTPSVLAGLVEASNRALDLGFTTLRRTLLLYAHYWKKKGKFSESLPRDLPYTDGFIKGPVEFSALQPKVRLFDRSKKSTSSTSSRFQRDERRYLWTTAINESEPRDENYAYVRWQRSSKTGSRLAEGFTVSDVVPIHPVPEFKYIWVPE